MERIKADVAIIGGGSAGLVAASGAAQLGQKVVLFEHGKMGGDCLNYGCVPSKSLIASARAAQHGRASGPLGVESAAPSIEWARVSAHVHSVIDAIAPIDSQERFEELGVRVVRETARFTGQRTIESASLSVAARVMAIAAGGRAAAPPIPGLADMPYLTNETVFSLTERPSHLIILGAGPIGLELGQAFRRLGANVTLIETDVILAGRDEDAANVLRTALRAEGVRILERARAASVARHGEGVLVRLDGDGPNRDVTGSHLLVAAGRRANVDGLGLDAAGVAYDARGVHTDAFLRTANKRIYALGDIASREQFTHVAGMHGSLFVRNALFRLSKGRADAAAIPRVIYTEPEYAAIGLSEPEARARFGNKVRVFTTPMGENDRAQTERDTDGFCRLVAKADGLLLGATIVGAQAGDLIAFVALALSQKMKLGAFTSGFIPPYPTRAEILKRTAGQYFTPTLFSAKTRALVRALSHLP